MGTNPNALDYVSAELQADEVAAIRAICLEKLGKAKDAYLWLKDDAPVAARSDRAIILAAVARNGSVLRLASAELRADQEIVLAAIATTARAFAYPLAELQADEVVLAAIRWQGQHARSEGRRQHGA